MIYETLFTLGFIVLLLLLFAYVGKYYRRQLQAHILFASEEWFVIVNLMLFGVAVYANFTLDQLFCTPVTWATALVLLFCTAFISSIFTLPKALQYLQAALMGTGLFIMAYIIVFASDEYLIWSVCMGYIFLLPMNIVMRQIQKRIPILKLDSMTIPALIVFTPYAILVQQYQYFKAVNPVLKKVFWGGFLLITITGFSLAFRLNYLAKEFTAKKQQPQAIQAMLTNPVDRYLGELVLGAHWKYHTELCMYDGTRPPLHDPVLGLATMLGLQNSVGQYHINIALYQKVFPNKSLQLNCNCKY